MGGGGGGQKVIGFLRQFFRKISFPAKKNFRAKFFKILYFIGETLKIMDFNAKV